MTADSTPRSAAAPRWRPAAVTTAAFIAAISVGTATATTAHAEPRQPGVYDYQNCVIAHEDGINIDHSKISWAAKFEIWENCCLDLGGTYNENTKECYMPDKSIGRPEPPPGATAIIPPGLNTVEGPTPRPPATAILPPDLNTRAGDQ